MVPALIFVLSLVWMQLVKGQGEEEVKKEQTERKINFEQAYQVLPSINCVLVFFSSWVNIMYEPGSKLSLGFL